jgi:hypothetical protein
MSKAPLPARGAFPDEAHFRQLRSLLWADPSRARASIMVGAGMSRNAISLRPDGPPMPLWGDLATAMAAEVWPESPKRRSEDALVLAEYFERLHKRTALDDFLRRHVRDTEFLPGRLHVLLMALPWADVFTTNYDTLLERACHQVLERRYAVVVNQSDLANARQPRIVKLNGSFPSHRPLIITQEDFRTYPTKFAAFVNTVQQAIMETAVCMIGFSGDDPNFQAWTGWVRDNLGTAAPPLYHCDVLDLDVARRSYYEARNVRPIDLGPLFPVADVPPSRRRAAALEWFLLSLAEEAPLDIESWPSVARRKPALPMTQTLSSVLAASSRHRGVPKAQEKAASQPRSPAAWEPTGDLPALIDAVATDLSNDAANSEPETLLATIGRLRRSYPGWILAPRNVSLEHAIPEWVRAVLDPAAIPSADELAAVAWAVDIANWPWPDEFLLKIESYLEAADASPSADALWLVRAIVREARERDEPERFEKWMAVLVKATSGNPVAVAQWWIEKAKFHLGRLELNEAARTLLCVTTQPSHPFLDVARGCILFELGQVQLAAAVSAEAVDQLRRQSYPQASHPRLLGEEASALDLAMAAMWAIDFGPGSVGTGYPRRRELARSGADPREALKLLGAELWEGKAHEEEISKGFDPGKWTKTVRNRYGDHSLRPHKLLRAIDVSAQLPINHKEDTTTAAVAIALERPGMAFAHLTRLGGGLDLAFSRERVVALSPNAVATLWHRCARFLRGMLDSNWQELGGEPDGLHRRCVSNSIDLLSRLTIRADETMRREGLQLACALHESRPFRRLWQLHEALASFFSRLFLVTPLDEQAEALPSLVALSIPEASEIAFQQNWRDPSSLVSSLGTRLVGQQEQLTAVAIRLANTLRSDDSFAKAIAVARLDSLDRAGGLSHETKRAYVDALWSHGDGDGGIPVVEGFSLHLGLLVSAGYPDARDRFKAWALGSNLPALFATREQFGRVLRQSQDHWVARHVKALERASLLPWSEGAHVPSLVDWTRTEAEQLLRKLTAWFEYLRSTLPVGSPQLAERDRDVLDDIGEFVARVLVPRIDSADADTRSHLDSIDGDLVHFNCVPLSRHPTWLTVDPSARVDSELRVELTSENDESVRRAIGWVYEWVMFAASAGLPAPPADIVDRVFLLASLAPLRARSIAFGTAYALYDRDRTSLTDQRRGWTAVALERLFRVREVPGEGVSVASIGDLKAAAARLLTALAVREPSTEPWKTLLEIARGDAYPEVRRACEEVQEDLLPGG